MTSTDGTTDLDAEILKLTEQVEVLRTRMAAATPAELVSLSQEARELRSRLRAAQSLRFTR